MKQTVIPAGYRVTVTSWENDGDNYNTKTMEGLSEPETKFIVDLLGILGSKSGHNDTASFDNMYEPSEEELEEFEQATRAVVARHDISKMSFGHYFETENVDEDEYWLDGVSEFLYKLGLCGGEFYTRVVDSYKVEYVPENIVIQDVTKQFQ